MRRWILFALASLIGGASLIAWLTWNSNAHTMRSSSLSGMQISVARGVTGITDISAFKQVVAPQPLIFPRDHGPHPDFATEWWYYTGNLHADDGRQFGYQLTFFRQGLHPHPPARASDWASSDIYLAHFALTDVASDSYTAADRLSRGGEIGLAGASASPYHVFVETWSAEGTGEVVRLRAHHDPIGIDLNLRAHKPATLQGDQGFAKKGSAAGQATYYYSFTRMETSGTVMVNGRSFTVEGLSWFDREWGTSALEENHIGWDWFALHFDDGYDLMWYQFLTADRSIDTRYSLGALVDEQGNKTSLRDTDVQLDALDTWISPHTNAEYPARWRLRVPEQNIDIEIRPLVADQEITAGFRYWEGAVSFTGTHGDRTVKGTGYVELTGYADIATDAAGE